MFFCSGVRDVQGSRFDGGCIKEAGLLIGKPQCLKKVIFSIEILSPTLVE